MFDSNDGTFGMGIYAYDYNYDDSWIEEDLYEEDDDIIEEDEEATVAVAPAVTSNLAAVVGVASTSFPFSSEPLAPILNVTEPVADWMFG
jgi:hypothetical protein